ncbi:hypothetical protein DFK95_18775 [Clostridioides difficile]|nr:hypothetical protein [Clostridioides difficile]EGT4708857.1 hypothetical protein [Clostridioides difficile]EGT4838129.1 hypothetical protein [Clostridioides difficile]EGT4914041.1 hypothetical protein [Clostridioides difficile]EGT5506043.1 hypothetical protein [Clostridioides difficile]
MYVSIGNTKFILGFYINYVVCKYYRIAYFWHIFYNFILTMWYVNYLFIKFIVSCMLCFILTIWA